MSRSLHQVRYRRSPHLVAYWDGTELSVRNFATGADACVPPRAAEVLDAYSAWRSIAAAARKLPRFSAGEVQQLTRTLASEGLLLRSDRNVSPAERRMSRIDAWNPAVGFFLSATRDLPWASLAMSRTVQRQVAAIDPWPGGAFAPRGAVTVTLPPPDVASPTSRACLERRTWRRFGDGGVTRQHLSSLLWLAGGVQQWARTDFGEFALKTSPSGGALHPVELYVLVRRIGGLARGFYHYSGADHVLRRVKSHSRLVPIDRYLPQQPWFEGSAAVVFLVAHYDRCLWRYKYPRAYRAPFIEAGHVAQTFCVRATELGLAPFVSMALADTLIESEIGADGVTRAVLYAAGVGIRPRQTWAPLPEGMGSLRARLNRPKPRRRSHA